MTTRSVVILTVVAVLVGPVYVCWQTYKRPARQRYYRGSCPAEPEGTTALSVVPAHVVPERRGKWGNALDVTVGETTTNTFPRSVEPR